MNLIITTKDGETRRISDVKIVHIEDIISAHEDEFNNIEIYQLKDKNTRKPSSITLKFDGE